MQKSLERARMLMRTKVSMHVSGKCKGKYKFS